MLGTNGAGKSTLQRAIAGLQQASNGAIFFDGHDITHRPPHLNARDGIVYMPGGAAIFPSLTVEQNLRAGAWIDDDASSLAQRISSVLDLFPELRDRPHMNDESAGVYQSLLTGLYWDKPNPKFEGTYQVQSTAGWALFEMPLRHEPVG